jgi:hypothetical protein
MGKGYDLKTILDKLQRPRGYQGCRIRPDKDWRGNRIYIAEMLTPNLERKGKSWKPLEEEVSSQIAPRQKEEGQRSTQIRVFQSPGEAEQALIDARGEAFTDNRPFFVQLGVGVPEDQQWRQLIRNAEQARPGSLEDMIEDGATRLTTAMRELRECQSQQRANQLYEIALGQSNRLKHLAHYAYEEAKQAQWLKIDQKKKTQNPQEDK